MQKIWDKALEVGWDETDMNGKLSLTGLSLILQRVAVEHAEHLGFGYSEISKDNVSWVLFRLNMQIFRSPRWKEKIRIRTWPREIIGLAAFREFILFSEKGDVLCNASSEWLIIDLTTRRPQRMDRFKEMAHLNTATKALDYHPLPLNTKCDFSPLFSITTRHSDLDLNGHTNARKYFDWLDDAIYQVHKEKEISFLQMNYFHECQMGEEISVEICQEDQKTFRGFKQESGKTAFIAQVEF
ncbi:MAG: thioesterase [Bacteroidales bacterium]|nr:thioesterase [Bacteroidales bacterium]